MKTVLHSPGYPNTWSPVSGAVRGDLGGMPLGVGLPRGAGFGSSQSCATFSLCSLLPVPATLLPTMTALSLWDCEPKLRKLLLVMVFSHSGRQVTNSLALVSSLNN